MAETKSKKPKKEKNKQAASGIDTKRFPKKVRKRRQTPKGPHGGMQIMLTEDVAHVGKQGEVVEVKPGYGRNYLLPYGMATYVTPEALKRIETHKAKVEALRLARLNDLKMLARKIGDISITIEANATEEGHLYGSVAEADIVKALDAAGFTVMADQVKLEGHLKELGLYNVKLAFEEEVSAELKVWVVPVAEKK